MAKARFQEWFERNVWAFERSYNLENPKVPINGQTVDFLFDGPPSKSGKQVNADNALTVSAMWRGIAVLGGAASSIPFKGYRKTATGRQELTEKETPAVGLITNRPNKKMTWPVWIDRALNHLHMRGNHYAYVERNGLGQAVELTMWNPDNVEVYEDKNEVYYKRKGEDRVYASWEVIHVPHLGDKIVGKGVVQYAKEDLGLEMSRRDYGSGVYAGGGRPPALLKTQQPLNEPQMDQAATAWKEMKKKGGDVLLPYGFDYQALSFKPDEVEFLNSGNFSVTTIARWLGVPPHKLYDLERATFSNIEHMQIEFLQDSIAPILVKFEYEYSDKLWQLDIEQKRGYYCEFNMNAYLRADALARAQAQATQVHAALLKPSEARAMENREFVEGSDRLFINQGSAPLDIIDQVALKKAQPTPTQKEKLKAKFNGQTQDILDILSE